MNFCDFVSNAMKTTVVVTGAIVAAPVFGVVGTITAAGTAVAVGVGITAAAADNA